MLSKIPQIFQYSQPTSLSQKQPSTQSSQNGQPLIKYSNKRLKPHNSQQHNKNKQYLLPVPFNQYHHNIYQHIINKYNISEYYLIYQSMINSKFNTLDKWNKLYHGDQFTPFVFNQIQPYNDLRQYNNTYNCQQNMLDIYVPITDIVSSNEIALYRRNNRGNNVRVVMSRTTLPLKKMDNYMNLFNRKNNFHTANVQDNYNDNSNKIYDQQKYDNYLYKYQIIKQLGKGMYGVVHLARKKIQHQNKQQQQKHQNTNNTNNLNFQVEVWKHYDEMYQINKNSIVNYIKQKSTQEEIQDDQMVNLLNNDHSINTIIHTKAQVQQPPTKASSPHFHPPQQNQSSTYPQQTYFAIKIYQKIKMSRDPMKLQKILQQVDIMKNINHPHIIKLYQTVNSGTKISLVVEYGGNQSLLEYLKENYPLSQAEQRKIGKQLLSALIYLHERHIVHRDIKLQNILMLRDQVKLIDFGFSTRTYKKTKLNTICGTPNYMAPEVLARKQYLGQNADIWSFGVVMYAIAEGRHPFNASNYRQLQKTVNKGILQFTNIINPIHKSFIRKILKIKPENRPSAYNLMNHPWLNIQDQQINLDQVD